MRVSNYVNDIAGLKEKYKEKFRDDNLYQGAYTRNDISPSKRASIVTTATSVGNYHIDYTWADMLDPNNVWCSRHWWWCEHWNGSISNISELRCDGVAEYSYEKHGVHVTNNNLIASRGQSHVNAHNDLHTYGYNSGELCPKIQAGENCNYYSPGSGTSRSYFDPLVSADPTTSNFRVQQFSNKIQLRFRVGDNASVKAYVLVQVKKRTESNWHVLIDKYENAWKFREVDLTDWNGNQQYDTFYLKWLGKYEGGHYTGSDRFDLKITVIDQGANYSNADFSFYGTMPRPILSGPGSLDSGELGTWVAYMYGGIPPYSYNWSYYKDCGGVEGEIVHPNAAPCGYWWNIGITTNTVSRYDYSSFLLRCIVTDAVSSTTTLNKYVAVGGGGFKIANNELIDSLSVENELIADYSLSSNYPNPFNPSTTISYQIPKDGFVSLVVYNSLGQEVGTLVNQHQSIGRYEIKFEASNLPSGVYIYKLQAGEFSSVKKMLLAK